MTYSENLWLYTTLLFGIMIVPGMDMMYVLANALTGGRRAGVAATAGMVVGGSFHTLFGATGVSVVVAWAPSLLNVLLFAGAAYMAWIGLTLMRSSIAVGSIEGVRSRSLWLVFRRAIVTCILNPKAYLFVFAVFPQFLKPQFGPLWSQAVVMGILGALVQIAVYGGLALAAGRSGEFLVNSPRATLIVGRAAGLLLIAVAALTAWQGWASSVSGG